MKTIHSITRCMCGAIGSFTSTNWRNKVFLKKVTWKYHQLTMFGLVTTQLQIDGKPFQYKGQVNSDGKAYGYGVAKSFKDKNLLKKN